MENIGPLVGRGQVSEVFTYGQDTVLKLFFPRRGREEVEREAEITRAIYQAGLPAPRVSDIVTVNDRYGLVMERVDGLTMMRWATSLPWRVYPGAKLLARLQANMHSKTGLDLTPLREVLVSRIENTSELDDRLKSMALERLSTLPDGDSVCHGDFHPDNIIMTNHGPVIIDWITGTSGPPAADVARSIVLFESGSPFVYGWRRLVLEAGRKIFLSVYLKEYFKITGLTREDVDPWMLPVAVARFGEVPEEERLAYMNYVRRLLPRRPLEQDTDSS